MNINIYHYANMSDEQKDRLMHRSEVLIQDEMAAMEPAIKAIKDNGDSAVIEYTRLWDNVDLNVNEFKVAQSEFVLAGKKLDQRIKKAIDVSAKNIRAFHTRQKSPSIWYEEISPGIMAGEKNSPIESVGLYIPHGKGSFPSVMLMLGIPAVLAGVKNIVVVSPPGRDKSFDEATLYAAQVCGIDRIFRIGGGQAIAALAFGTETIPKVDKIIGPGNSYVTAAKRLVQNIVDVGPPAGPSEAIIFCDDTTDPQMAATDLLIEAEHGPDSTSLVVTSSTTFALTVAEMTEKLISDLSEIRQQYCRSSLATFGGIMVTEDFENSIDFINTFAPEHLEILTRDPMAILPLIRNAGEILLGPFTPITLGNFSLGINAVLPTGGHAKTVSGVTIHDFMKKTSIGYVNKTGFLLLKDAAHDLAVHEGFCAHANAVKARERYL